MTNSTTEAIRPSIIVTAARDGVRAMTLSLGGTAEDRARRARMGTVDSWTFELAGATAADALSALWAWMRSRRQWRDVAKYWSLRGYSETALPAGMALFEMT